MKENNLGINLSSEEQKILIPYRLNNKWGFSNQEKVIIIDCNYDSVSFFNDGLAEVWLQNLLYVVDESGQRYESESPFSEDSFISSKKNSDTFSLHDIEFGAIDVVNPTQKCPLASYNTLERKITIVKIKGKLGFINRTLNVVIPPIYDEIKEPFINESREFFSRIGDKWGMVDSSGKIISECIYEDYNRSGFCNDCCAVKINGLWGFIDIHGKEIVPCIYSNYLSFSEGFAAVEQNGKWGYVNIDGNEVIPCAYQNPSYFENGLVKLIDGHYGIILNEKGDVVLKVFCLCILDIHHELGLVTILGFGRRKNIIKMNGECFIEDSFMEVEYSEQDKGFYVTIKDEHTFDYYVGFIDINGKMILPCKFEDITVHGEYLYGKAGIKYCIFRRDGSFISNPYYENIFFRGNGMIYKKSGKYGFADFFGRTRSEKTFDEIEVVDDKNVVLVANEGKWGIINFSRSGDIQFIFDRILLFNDFFRVQSNDYWGVVNSYGELIVNCTYEWIANYSEGMAAVRLNGKWGFINSDAKLVVSCKYATFKPFNNGLCAVLLDNNWGVIDTMGNEYWED